MSPLEKIHPLILEALCCWESFRRVGFAAEQIYLRRLVDGRLTIGLQQENFWVMICLPGGMGYELQNLPEAQLLTDWKAAAEVWNTLAAEESGVLDEAFRRSNIHSQSIQFLLALESCGIRLPCASDA